MVPVFEQCPFAGGGDVNASLQGLLHFFPHPNWAIYFFICRNENARDNKSYIETYETLQGAKDLATTQGHFVKDHTKLEDN